MMFGSRTLLLTLSLGFAFAADSCRPAIKDPLPEGVVCGLEGRVVNPAPLVDPVTQSSVRDCKNFCFNTIGCRSFSFNQSIRLLTNTLFAIALILAPRIQRVPVVQSVCPCTKVQESNNRHCSL